MEAVGSAAVSSLFLFIHHKWDCCSKSQFCNFWPSSCVCFKKWHICPVSFIRKNINYRLNDKISLLLYGWLFIMLSTEKVNTLNSHLQINKYCNFSRSLPGCRILLTPSLRSLCTLRGWGAARVPEWVPGFPRPSFRRPGVVEAVA